MHILIMAQHYAPEEVSGAVLATDLAEELINRGHQVTFVTCAPNYPYGRVCSGYKNNLWNEEVRNGVRVIRTWSFISQQKTFWRQILGYASFSVTALLGAFKSGRPDVIFSYSPPLPLGVTAWLYSRLKRTPWVLRVEDLYPDTAVKAGQIKNRLAIHLFYWIEKFLYLRAEHISLISDTFKQNLLDKGIENNKLSVTPVWADPERIMPMPKKNGFREKYRLENRFVVMYTGNLGNTSALEDLLASAVYLKEDANIIFIIIGEGVKKTLLQNYVQNNFLENVIFLPYQPRQEYASVLAAADIGVVTLNVILSDTSLPSKTFNIMASARPILAITPDQSEIARLITSTQCGVNVPPGQHEKIANTIRLLVQHPGNLDVMGSNGRKVLEEFYSSRVCIDSLEQIMKKVCQRH